jgi:hypothetical protein
MCYVTMSPNRPTWKFDNGPTPEEALIALRGINSYCATLEIHANEGLWIDATTSIRIPTQSAEPRDGGSHFKGQTN